jgi:hypothetical protein
MTEITVIFKTLKIKESEPPVLYFYPVLHLQKQRFILSVINEQP